KVVESSAQVWEEVSCRPHGGEEAVRSPAPVPNDGIDETRDTERVKQVANKSGAADHGARGDGGAGVSERELEYPDGHESDAGRLIGVWHALQEEPVITDEAVAVAEHERKTNGIEQNAAEACIDNALHQNVHCLSRPTEARLKHGEANLHAEHEER